MQVIMFLNILISFLLLFGRCWHLRRDWRTNTKLLNRLQMIGNSALYIIITLILVNSVYSGLMFFSCVFVFKFRYRRAQLALQKGDEDLACEALKRRKSYAVSTYEILNLAVVVLYYWITPPALKIRNKKEEKQHTKKINEGRG